MKIGKAVLVLSLAMGSALPAAAEPNVDPNVAERAAHSVDLVRFQTEAAANPIRTDKPCKSPRRAKSKERRPPKPTG